MNRLTVFLIILSVFGFQKLSAQDTTRYLGIIAEEIVYESFELYPNSKFKWTSEFDLSWSEYGFYEIENDTLTLCFHNSISIEEITSNSAKCSKIMVFIKEANSLIQISPSGKRISRIKDKSIRTKWSWLFGHEHKYEIIKTGANIK